MTMPQQKRWIVITVMISAILIVTLGFTQTALAAPNGSITIQVAGNPADSPFNYFGNEIGFRQLTVGDSYTQPNLETAPGNSYTIFQNNTAGYVVDIDCGDTTVLASDVDPTVTNVSVTLELTDGEAAVCTFTNTYIGGSVNIVADGGSNLFYFGTGSNGGAFGSFTMNDGDNRLVSDLLPSSIVGGYEIFQSTPSGFSTEVDCGSASVEDISEGNNVGRRITLGTNEDVTCTFTNTDLSGSITVEAAGDAADSPYSYFGDLNGFALTVGETFSATNLLPGDYRISQSRVPGYETTMSCTGGDYVDLITPNDIGVIVSLDASEDVVCTAQNTFVGASITIVTNGEVAGDSFDYFGALNQFTQTVGMSTTFGTLLPGTYEILQSVPGTYLSSVSCVRDGVPFGDISSTQNSAGVSLMIEAFEDVVCTFENDYIGSTVVLVATGDIGVLPFELTGTLGTVSLNAGDVVTIEDVAPGLTDIVETIPAGFLVSAECSIATTDISTPGNVGIRADVPQDSTVTCTFDHEDVGSTITVVAASDPAGLTGIEFYGDLGMFTLDDGQSLQSAPLYAGTYELFQNAVTDYTIAIDCTGTVSTTALNGVTLDLAANEDVTCTFTNTNDTPETILINGNFDEGQNVGWEEWSRRGFDLVVEDGAYGTQVDPQSGDYMAWLGGARREHSYLWQWVTLPDGQASSLDFSHQIKSRDWCGYDWGTVYVYDGHRVYLLWYQSLCRNNRTQGWEDISLDLSAFAGETIAITFFSRNDWSYASSFFIDDVAIVDNGALARSAASRNDLNGMDATNADIFDLMAEDTSYESARGLEVRTEGVDDSDDSNRDATDGADVTAVHLQNTGAESTSPMMHVLLVALSILIACVLTLYRREK